MMRFLFSLILIVFCAPCLAEDGWTPNIQTKTLKNGMQVVVIENHAAPIVTHMMWYKVGSADDPWGKSGIAHFLEHLMFKGGETLEDGEYSMRVREMGGNENAFTSKDYTAYHVSAPADKLPQIMHLEAQRMKNLAPSKDAFEKERLVVLEERGQRIESNPSSKLMEALTASLFTNSPYSRPTIGWEGEIKKLDRKSVVGFYKKHYNVSNAILIVHGDVAAENVFKLAKKEYGGFKPIDLERKARTQVPDLGAINNHIELYDKNTRQAEFIQLWRVPSWNGDENASRALEVAANMLGGSSTSHLYKTIVIEQKLATSINAYYNPNAIDDGIFAISATPTSGTNIKDLETAINKEIENFAPSDKDLSASKTQLLANTLYEQDTMTGSAYSIGSDIAVGKTINDIKNWPSKIGSITTTDVQTVVEQYLKGEKSHFVIGALLPYPDSVN